MLVINNSTYITDYSEWGERMNRPMHTIRCSELRTLSIESILHNVTVILITGGPQHIPTIHEYPELLIELQIIEHAIRRNIKIIGICLGFQLINHYFGNEVLELKAPCIGHNLLDSTEPSMETVSRAFSFHNDGVLTNRNPDIIVIAKGAALSYTGGLVYCIRHRVLPIFAIQSHPEFTREKIQMSLKTYSMYADLSLHEADTYAKIRDAFISMCMGAVSLQQDQSAF